MHPNENLVLVPQNPKNPHRGRGIHPPPWCPIKYLTTETPHPLLNNHNTFGATIDVNLNFIMHPKTGFSTPPPQKKKSHRGRGIQPPPLWFPIPNHFKRVILLPTPPHE